MFSHETGVEPLPDLGEIRPPLFMPRLGRSLQTRPAGIGVDGVLLQRLANDAARLAWAMLRQDTASNPERSSVGRG